MLSKDTITRSRIILVQCPRRLCKACNKASANGVTLICVQTCSDCMARPPCAFSAVTIPRAVFYSFKDKACYRTSRASRRQNAFVTTKDAVRPLECSRETINTNVAKVYEICKQNREVGHLCNMRLLRKVLPAHVDNVVYVFSDFQNTQNKRYSDKRKHTCLNSSVRISIVRGAMTWKTK